MTPAARLSAAIEILDLYLGGTPAEKALTNWARRSRFAGSKDRAAIRDIVFDCLRRRESLMASAGARTGRACVAAYAVEEHGWDATQQLFSGEGHAPSALTEAETAALSSQAPQPLCARYDLPDWLIPRFDAAMGAASLQVAHELKSRAPVFVRVNTRRSTRAEVAAMLAQDGIATTPHPRVETALAVTENPRRLTASPAYRDGLIELQDASSQAVCAALPQARRMLDYCAGGGGKVLAYGAAHDAQLYAYDANPARLRDLPDRASRARIKVALLDQQGCKKAAPFDLVLTDVPCSGSGSWRRAPEGKWALTPEKLDDLIALQARVMDEAAQLVTPGGCLAYATCSVLREENEDQVAAFLARSPGFSLTYQQRFAVCDQGDGFFVAHLTQAG